MKKIAYIFVSALLLASCSDFLQRNPIAQIGSEDYFTNETSLKTYLNGFINSYTPNHSAVAEEELAGDVLVSVLSWVDYLASDWSPDIQSGWSSSDWNPIYNINYFLKHCREVPGLSEETYKHYEATARFWRAFKYFAFVKKFGAVPFYTEPIDAADAEALYKPRDNREDVMKWILEDLDFACQNLSTSSEWVDNANINKYIALNLTMNLFNGMQTRESVAQAKSDVRTTQIQKDAAERGFRLQIESCLNDMDDAQKQLEIKKRSVELAQKNQEMTDAAFKVGKDTQINLLNANMSLRTAKLNYMEAVLNWNNALNALQQATGEF